MTPDQIRARGWAYWQRVYSGGSQNLLDGMHRAYPDMGCGNEPLLLADSKRITQYPMYTVP